MECGAVNSGPCPDANVLTTSSFRLGCVAGSHTTSGRVQHQHTGPRIPELRHLACSLAVIPRVVHIRRRWRVLGGTALTVVPVRL
eukprot:7385040-Prymnesium_polylepis.1